MSQIQEFMDGIIIACEAWEIGHLIIVIIIITTIIIIISGGKSTQIFYLSKSINTAI